MPRQNSHSSPIPNLEASECHENSVLDSSTIHDQSGDSESFEECSTTHVIMNAAEPVHQNKQSPVKPECKSVESAREQKLTPVKPDDENKLSSAMHRIPKEQYIAEPHKVKKVQTSPVIYDDRKIQKRCSKRAPPYWCVIANQTNTGTCLCTRECHPCPFCSNFDKLCDYCKD